MTRRSRKTRPHGAEGPSPSDSEPPVAHAMRVDAVLGGDDERLAPRPAPTSTPSPETPEVKGWTLDVLIRWAIVLYGLGLFAYVCLRAVYVGITHDEACTYQYAVKPGLGRILTFDYVDANNHLLNSVLVWASRSLFGSSPWALRLPNVGVFALFLWAAGSISRSLTRPWARLAAFIVLTTQPFVLEFFGLARGYGLAMGLMAASLACWNRGLREPARSKPLRLASLWLAAVAVLANLSYVNLFVPLLMLLLLDCAAQRECEGPPSPRQRLRGLVRCGLPLLQPALVVACLITPVAIKLHENRKLFFGGTEGFFEDTVKTLVNSLLVGAPYSAWSAPILSVLAVVIVAYAVVAFGVGARKHGWRTRSGVGLTVLSLLVLASLSTVVQHYLFGTRFLIERTAMLFVLPFSACLVFLADDGVPFRRVGSIVLAVAAIGSGAHFAIQAQVHSTSSWRYDSDTEAMVRGLSRETSPADGRKLRLGAAWIHEPAVNYYFERLGLNWFEPMTRRGFEGYYDAYFGTPAEIESAKGPSLTVVERYAESSTVLAVPQQPLAAWMLEVNRGIEAYRNEDLGAALKHLQPVAAAHPESLRAVTYLGQTHAGMGAYREAIPLLERVIQADAATADAAYWLAISESQLGQLDTALTHAKLALQLDPGHFDAQRFLALLHAYRKECALSAQALQAACELRLSYRDSDEYRQIVAECGQR
jgi:hypothetical protein